MAEKGSDMDLVVYLRERDCMLDELDTCQIPRPLAAVFKALEKRELNIEVCDSLDLDRVRRAIEREHREDGQLQRFIFYRIVCRPVNLRLIKGVENLLLAKERFRKEVERGLKDYLEILVSSVRHVSSFEKYKSRLRERGIPLKPPPGAGDSPGPRCGGSHSPLPPGLIIFPDRIFFLHFLFSSINLYYHIVGIYFLFLPHAFIVEVLSHVTAFSSMVRFQFFASFHIREPRAVDIIYLKFQPPNPYFSPALAKLLPTHSSQGGQHAIHESCKSPVGNFCRDDDGGLR
ncbi:MAG: hypothetical protein JRI80_11735, partial [Deltaproteobacteria bacterium]|nr:hypothetical protein [Deltaproteobacteria bacterium]